jgi:hypothetical protein
MNTILQQPCRGDISFDVLPPVSTARVKGVSSCVAARHGLVTETPKRPKAPNARSGRQQHQAPLLPLGVPQPASPAPLKPPGAGPSPPSPPVGSPRFLLYNSLLKLVTWDCRYKALLLPLALRSPLEAKRTFTGIREGGQAALSCRLRVVCLGRGRGHGKMARHRPFWPFLCHRTSAERRRSSGHLAPFLQPRDPGVRCRDCLPR